MNQKTITIITFLISLAAIGGYALGNSMSPIIGNEGQDPVQSIRQSGYKFINPLLECETKNEFSDQKYIPFEFELLKKIKKEVQFKNPDVKLSLYFRNLNNGPWFGINENELFFPASLIKLPILIMYLHWSENQPGLFEKKLKVETLSDISQVYKGEKELEPGKEYTVKQLLEYLIMYSDNSAINPLLSILPKDIQIQIFTDLGVPPPTSQGYELSTKNYASFFRILYNASYLTKGLSEDALALLSQTTFREGLRANIPDNIRISHKFGEREIIGDGNTTNRQLHDCGIIYYPGYPYLLCIMTKGESTDMNKLSEVIKKSSNIVYDEISSKYPLVPTIK